VGCMLGGCTRVVVKECSRKKGRTGSNGSHMIHSDLFIIVNKDPDRMVNNDFLCNG